MITFAEDGPTPKHTVCAPTFCGYSVCGDRGGPSEACGKLLPCAEHPSVDWRKRAECAERTVFLLDELIRGVRPQDPLVDTDGIPASLMEYLESSPWYESASSELRGYYDELVSKSAEVSVK